MPLFSPDQTRCFVLNPKCASSFIESVLTRVGWTFRRMRHEPARWIWPGYEFYATIRPPWDWYESVWHQGQRETPWRLPETFEAAVRCWMCPAMQLDRGKWPPTDNLAIMGEAPFDPLYSAAQRFFLEGVDHILPLARLPELLEAHFGVDVRKKPPVNARGAARKVEWSADLYDLVEGNDGRGIPYE